MSAPFSVLSISFDRVTGTGDPLSLPVRTAKTAAVHALDWENVSGSIKSRAVAISRKSPGPIVLSVTLDVPAALTNAIRIRATVSGSTIGSVKEKSLGTPPPGLLTVKATVDGPSFIDLAVGEFPLTWTWEFKSGTNPWTPFQTTQHRIFVLADEPAEPWGRPGTPATVVPWDDVIAFACRAAAGLKTTETCASAVTKAVFALGATGVGYSGAANFSGGNGVYFLGNFFSTVNLKSGAAMAMNCADLAGAVAMLSSAIGCRQVAARLEPKPGAKIHTNPIEMFGATSVHRETFEFHEFAATRTAAGNLGSRVWDACFRIDMGSTPTVAPHTLGLATNLPQQPTLAERGYLKQLLKPASPAPAAASLVFGDGVQYPEDLPSGVLMPTDAFLENKHIELDALLKVKPDPERISLKIVAQVHAALTNSAEVVDVRTYTVARATYPENVLRWPVSDKKTIHVSFFTAGPDAKWIFLRRAAQITRPPQPLEEVGESAILSPENDAVVMKFRDTVVYLVNDSRTRDSLTDIARQIAKTVQEAYN